MIKNLNDFRATRNEVDDLSQHIDFMEGAPGYVYADGAYIEKCADGRLLLTLFNDQWHVEPERLDELELRLYEFFVTEGAFSEGENLYAVEDALEVVTAVSFANALEHAIGWEKFAEMRARNKADPLTVVCHSHDFCDANVTMDAAMDEAIGIVGHAHQRVDRQALFSAAWVAAKPLLGRNAVS